MAMRYGWVLPYGDARTAAELAVVAEDHGWDAFFVWEPVWGIDAWVALTAAAMRTERIRLGTMLTPLPRRLPWDVASQVATLDNLSGGRVILSVGLGAPDDRWWLFEDDPGRRTRAERRAGGVRRRPFPRPAGRPPRAPSSPAAPPRADLGRRRLAAAAVDAPGGPPGRLAPGSYSEGPRRPGDDARGAARRPRLAAGAAGSERPGTERVRSRRRGPD